MSVSGAHSIGRSVPSPIAVLKRNGTCKLDEKSNLLPSFKTNSPIPIADREIRNSFSSENLVLFFKYVYLIGFTNLFAFASCTSQSMYSIIP